MSPNAPEAISVSYGPQRLRHVFDHGQPVFLGYLADPVHVAELAEEVDDDDGPCVRCDGPFDQVRVYIHILTVDVDEDRSAAQEGNGARRGKERIRCGDNLIIPLYVKRHEGEDECIRAVCARKRIGHA